VTIQAGAFITRVLSRALAAAGEWNEAKN